MMTNITTPDSDDVRQYLIVYVDMPKGENTGPVASEINKFLSNKLNLSNSVLFIFCLLQASLKADSTAQNTFELKQGCS